MDEKINFLVYCIENYKNTQGITGKTVIEIFDKYSVLEYINKSYEALHTAGKEYIIEDIKTYINLREQKDSKKLH